MKKIGLIVLVLLFLALLLAPSAAFAQISGYNADFQIQNLSSSDAATVAINFYDQSGTVAATVNDTIPADSSTTYSPLPSSVPTGFNGSVVVSSDQPVAAIANVKGTSGGADFGSSYSSFSGGADSVSLPLINKDFYGINTWFNVQNTGSAATTVTVSYSNQSTCDETATIQPNAANTFDQETNTCLPSSYNGGATITTGSSGDEIVATVLQTTSLGLFAYNGFASGGTDVVFPLVTQNVYGINSGIQIQNQGGTATDVTVSYTPSGTGNGTACTETGTIQPSGAETFSINVFTGAASNTTSDCVVDEYFIGSASVTTNSASQSLVGIVNQTNFINNGGSSYGAFSPGAATDTIVMPLLMDAYNIWTGWAVMNVGSSADVTCTYSGTSISVTFSGLGTNESQDVQNLNGGTGDSGQTLPASYIGSGTCTATSGGALIGVVNQANTNVPAGSGDGTLTYEAFNN